MNLQFCPVCKALLMIKEESEKSFLYCKCGFRRYNFDIESSDKSIAIPRGDGIIKEDIGEGNQHICKKCGCDKAEIIDLGERDTNESGVYIFKCMKCGYSER